MLKPYKKATGTLASSEQRRQAPKQARLQRLKLFLVLLSAVVGWRFLHFFIANGQHSSWYYKQLHQESVHWSWRDPTCPLEYKRHKWTDIQAGKKKPYLFGGQQEPECTNCDRDALWSHFCQFRSYVSSFIIKQWLCLLAQQPAHSFCKALDLSCCICKPQNPLCRQLLTHNHAVTSFCNICVISLCLFRAHIVKEFTSTQFLSGVLVHITCNIMLYAGPGMC